MSIRLQFPIRTLAVLFLVPMITGVSARRVAAQQMDDGQATVKGEVVDSVTAQPIVGAWVGVTKRKEHAFTDAHGRFELAGLPAGPVEITVEQLGYKAWSETPTLTPGDANAMSVSLVPDPVMLSQIAVYANELRDRRDALATDVRAWGASQIATSPAHDAMEFVEQNAVTPLRCPPGIIATTCILRRGRVAAPSIWVNDVRYPPGLETLRNYDTHDLWLVEVLGQGAMIRIYTKGFAERLALGEERMMPVIY